MARHRRCVAYLFGVREWTPYSETLAEQTPWHMIEKYTQTDDKHISGEFVCAFECSIWCRPLEHVVATVRMLRLCRGQHCISPYGYGWWA